MSESKGEKASSGIRWWEVSGEAACVELKTSARDGLSAAEHQQRLAQFGKNEIPAPPASSLLALIIEQFKDLLVLILLGAAIVSFLLALFEEGEDRLTAFVEPAVILIILGCNAAVGVIQETNAEKAIQKLKASEASVAHVIRGGSAQQAPAADLVPGDIVVVQIGDKVPADIRIIGPPGVNMLADESALTGESDPAQKHGDVILDKPQAVNQDKRNILFSGTLVVKGQCTGVVVLTGGATEIGKIGSALSEKDDNEKTPLQAKLDEFGEQLSKVIACICALVWLINIGHFTDPDHGSWLKGAIYYFKIAVALAVAAIPEGLPAVVTTCLALGTLKMAKKNAIVRSLPSVETLGCTTVICSDKTGTLTTNMMSVQKVLVVDTVREGPITFKEFSVTGNTFDPFGNIEVDEGKRALVHPISEEPALLEVGKIAAICNESTLVWDAKKATYSKTGASTEAALKVLAEKIGLPDAAEHKRVQDSKDPAVRVSAAFSFWDARFRRQQVLEFDRKRKSMSVLAAGPTGAVLFVKGAPEGEFGVLARCTAIRGANGDVASMTQGTRTALNERLATYASLGLRVLALAYTERVDVSADFKDSDRYAAIESSLTFVGFTCMLDPPRAEVAESIQKCKSAHIRVIVITGDNPETATAICRSIGVFTKDEDVKDKVYIGSVWEHMSREEKHEAVKRANLFSRVEPKHKQELVRLLQSHGEVVAMTGDGVNDATALKKADIGVAMGSGTDVAREASDMVLQDDNFATIVMAVEEGRAIYANTKQFIRYLISSNIGEVACIFLTAAIGMPEALIPVQLLWVNLVTDGLPATALGFNPPDKDVMSRQPRGRTESIINGWMFFRYLVIGVYVGIGTVGGFIWWFLYAESGPKVSWAQLTNFHDCNSIFKDGAAPPAADSIWSGFSGDCQIFHHDTPSTVSLSVLVMIEMFNALNGLSENQSLLRVGPFTNLWVVAACALSFFLHLVILHVPFFNGVFHVTPLNAEEWKWTFYFSFPVFILDELLKLASRQMKEKALQKVAVKLEDLESKEEKKTKKDL